MDKVDKADKTPKAPKADMLRAHIALILLPWVAFAFPFLEARQAPEPHVAVFGCEDSEMLFGSAQGFFIDASPLRIMKHHQRWLRGIFEIVFQPLHGILALMVVFVRLCCAQFICRQCRSATPL